MTTYVLPAEPAGPLYTRDEDGAVEPWDYNAENRHWVSRSTGDQRPWANGPANLLALGPSDRHPDLPEGVTGPLRWSHYDDYAWVLVRDSNRDTLTGDEDFREFVLRAVRREVERIERGEPAQDRPTDAEFDALRAAIRSGRCDCYLRENQVCDVCQGVSGEPTTDRVGAGWVVAVNGEIVDVHTGEQIASTYGNRDLAERIVRAVNGEPEGLRTRLEKAEAGMVDDPIGRHVVRGLTKDVNAMETRLVSLEAELDALDRMAAERTAEDLVTRQPMISVADVRRLLGKAASGG